MTPRPRFTARRGTLRIGLLGPYGYGNLGDAAIQDAAVHHIRRRHAAASICCLSLNPRDSAERHGVPAFGLYPPAGTPSSSPHDGLVARVRTRVRSAAWRRQGPLWRALRAARRAVDHLTRVAADLRFNARVFAIVRQLDLLIISGGGQLNEYWGGAWRHPYTMWRWSLAARLAGTDVLVVSVGTGTIRSRLSRFFVRRALRLAAFRSYRHQQDRAVAIALGGGPADRVSPDLAFGLPRPAPVPKRAKSVVVAPMALFDPRAWPEKDQGEYSAYLTYLADVVEHVTGRGFAVRLLGTHIHMDRRSIDDLLDTLRARSPERSDVLGAPVATVTELLDELARAEFVIASRYHAVLLAHVVATPVLALSYDRKVRGLMEDVGLPEYCLDLPPADPTVTPERIGALLADRARIRARAEAYTARQRRLVEALWDELLGVATTAADPPIPVPVPVP